MIENLQKNFWLRKDSVFSNLTKLFSSFDSTIRFRFFCKKANFHEYDIKILPNTKTFFQVRAIHDVKGIDMGNNLVRYKAELDFDGRELTRSYLDKHDLNAMLEVKLTLILLQEQIFLKKTKIFCRN